MIERHWKGIAKNEAADHYIDHLLNDTFPKLSVMAGFLGSSILRRKVDDGVEFRIVTVWNSLDAIRQFAGDNPEVAVVPPVVREIMVEYDAAVTHYDVVVSRHQNIQ
jgi:heme-degrading monooxygenase HmoA